MSETKRTLNDKNEAKDVIKRQGRHKGNRRPQQIDDRRQSGHLSEKCKQENFFLRGEK